MPHNNLPVIYFVKDSPDSCIISILWNMADTPPNDVRDIIRTVFACIGILSDCIIGTPLLISRKEVNITGISPGI